jgi:hypothetical protein
LGNPNLKNPVQILFLDFIRINRKSWGVTDFDSENRPSLKGFNVNNPGCNPGAQDPNAWNTTPTELNFGYTNYIYKKGQRCEVIFYQDNEKNRFIA